MLYFLKISGDLEWPSTTYPDFLLAERRINEDIADVAGINVKPTRATTTWRQPAFYYHVSTEVDNRPVSARLQR